MFKCLFSCNIFHFMKKASPGDIFILDHYWATGKLNTVWKFKFKLFIVKVIRIVKDLNGLNQRKDEQTNVATILRRVKTKSNNFQTYSQTRLWRTSWDLENSFVITGVRYNPESSNFFSRRRLCRTPMLPSKLSLCFSFFIYFSCKLDTYIVLQLKMLPIFKRVPKKLTELIKTPQNDCWFMINELKIGVWVCYNRVSVRYNQENTMLSSPKPTKYNFLFALTGSSL